MPDAGRDKVQGFATGQWVEVTDDFHEIQGRPGPLTQLQDVAGNVLTLGVALDPAEFPGTPKVRLWNAPEATVALAADDDGWLKLEDGVEIRFEPGTYRAGDYWLIPARAFIGEFSGDIEWPQEGGKPAALPPDGVTHHFCKLAVADFDAGTKKFSNVHDCRPVFPAVTELVQLCYVGGDGQEAGSGEMLPQPLEVRVSNGRWPQPGVQVMFRVVEGKGQLGSDRAATALAPELVVTTDAEGLAACFWTLGDDAADPRQRVEAVPLDVAGNPFPGQLVHFNAGHNRDAGVVVRGVTALADKKSLDNDSLVGIGRLLDGLLVTTDRKLADVFSFPPIVATQNQPPFPPKPNFQIILHVPFPQGIGGGLLGDFAGVVGFQPLLLDGTVTLAETGAQWAPTILCRRWLQSVLLQRLDPNRTPGFRLLLQVVLKGRFIWSAEDPSLFLDGEAFGRLRRTEVGFSLPSGDGRRGGDFEAWFWLVQDPVVVGPGGPVNPVILNPVILNPG